MRLDQWLWAVRLYRTRTVAANAIKSGWVSVDGAVVKPARDVQAGQVIRARTGNFTRTYRAVGIPPARVGANLVSQFAEDQTPPEEFTRHRELLSAGVGVRSHGTGRPSKRERRATDRWNGELD